MYVISEQSTRPKVQIKIDDVFIEVDQAWLEAKPRTQWWNTIRRTIKEKRKENAKQENRSLIRG